MKALHIHVGERARRHIEASGLQPHDIRLVPAAAGGPEGLILSHLGRHLFGRWLPQGGHTVHVAGASIGAWRMATAAMADPVRSFADLSHGYIAQHIEPEAGRKMPSPRRVTQGFTDTLQGFFFFFFLGFLSYPCYLLLVLTSCWR